MDTLARINKERGISILCKLHNLELARPYTERAIGVRDGRVVFDGPTAALDQAVRGASQGEHGAGRGGRERQDARLRAGRPQDETTVEMRKQLKADRKKN